MAHLLIPLLALALLAGCASGTLGTLPHVADPDRAAHIVVVRPYTLVGSGAAIPVTIDGATVCEIGTAEHISIPVPEGERIIGLSTWSASVLFARAHPTHAIHVERGRTYYFRVGPHDAINRITEESGRALVKETTPLQDNAWQGRAWGDRGR